MSPGTNGDRRVEDRNTRDTAVRAESLVNAHMVDCAAFRLTLERKLDGLDTKLNKMAVWLCSILGGLTVIGKIWDKIHF